MPGASDFFTGLLGGLAQGMTGNLVAKRKQEMQQEQQQIDLVEQAVKQGNYEILSIVDKSLLNKLGIKGDNAKAFEALAGLQRQQRATKAEQAQVELSGAKQKQEAVGLELADTKERLATPYAQRPENVTAQAKAKIASAQAEVEPQVLAQQAEESKLRMEKLGSDLNLSKLQVTQAQQASEALHDPSLSAEDKLALRIPGLSALRGNQEKLSEAQYGFDLLKRQPEDVQLQALYPGVASADRAKAVELERVHTRIATMYKDAIAKKKSDRGEPLFDTEDEAQSFKLRLEEEAKRIAQIDPKQSMQFEVKSVATPGTGLLRKGIGTVIGQPQSYTVLPRGSSDAKATEAAPQGSLADKFNKTIESLQKEEAGKPTTPQSTATPRAGTLAIPQGQGGRNSWLASIGAAKKTLDKAKQKQILTDGGIPSSVAAQVVDGDMLDMLMQEVITSGKLSRGERK